MDDARKIEILEMINNLISVDVFFRRGICDILYHLSFEKIDDIEYDIMREFLNKHRPDIDDNYIEFTQNDYWNPYPNIHNYWWETMTSNPETRQLRKDYLMKLIANLK